MVKSITIVGNGRIGSAVRALLTSNDWQVRSAELDPETGLSVAGKVPDTPVEKLLICISPPRAGNNKREPWTWQAITAGLSSQARAKIVTIEQLYFVSSTRVYDGYKSGLVWAHSPTRPDSEKARALVAAEQSFKGCATKSTIIRPTGLYGRGYDRYQEIIQQPSAKLRHGVAAEQVATIISQLCSLPAACQPTDVLLTDGKVYVDGIAVKLNLHVSQVQKLARTQRLLINSVH